MRHWKMAECSESTGRIFALYSMAISMTVCPAATRVSLLARAIVLPALIAATVDASPLNPTIEVRTISMSSLVTRSQTDCIPAKTFTKWGLRA